MTSRDRRQSRRIAGAAGEVVAQRDRLLDLLNAILAHRGGIVRIPMGTVESATRRSVNAWIEGDDLVVSLFEQDAVPRPLLGRIREALRG